MHVAAAEQDKQLVAVHATQAEAVKASTYPPVTVVNYFSHRSLMQRLEDMVFFIKTKKIKNIFFIRVEMSAKGFQIVKTNEIDYSPRGYFSTI